MPFLLASLPVGLSVSAYLLACLSAFILSSCLWFLHRLLTRAVSELYDDSFNIKTYDSLLSVLLNQLCSTVVHFLVLTFSDTFKQTILKIMGNNAFNPLSACLIPILLNSFCCYVRHS